jgi:RNA polymerase sigma-70 factor (ECF subfamily)
VTDHAQPAIEAQIADLLARGDRAAAATVGLRAYGPAVLGYLVALLRNRDDAYEAFAGFSEQLWKSLDRFAGASSFRTWSYGIAWHVAKQSQRRHARDRSRPLETSEISRVAEEIRSATSPHLKTEIKDRFARLREELDPEDQTLLVLRLDRGLSWKEVAEVLSDEDHAIDEPALRKRFSRLKGRLRVALASDG